MDDFIWRAPGSMMIARYVPSEQIEVGTKARINPDEVCAYEEDGGYVGPYPELSPLLKPRPGWFSRLRGREPPQRNHLFVSKGPHKMIMRIESKWSNREEANADAIITISIPTDHVGRLFNLARNADEGIVTAQTLISAVEMDISSRFRTYVMGLHDPEDFQSPEDFIEIEKGFEQIAENELSKLGVNVESVAISYANTSDDNIVDLQKSVDRVMKKNMAERRLKGEDSFHDTSAALDAVADSIEAKALALAHGGLSDRSAEWVAREMIESQERELLRRIEDKEAESRSASKVRGVELKSQEDQALILAAQALQNLVGATEDGTDGSDGDE